MTIREVRLSLYSNDRANARALNRSHAGFTHWFNDRLKTSRPQLRGAEVKGINILSFEFRPPGMAGLTAPGEWKQLLNVIAYTHVIDTDQLLQRPALENIALLMQIASSATLSAPWPQVQAVGRLLASAPTQAESMDLQRCLDKWAEFVGDPD